MHKRCLWFVLLAPFLLSADIHVESLVLHQNNVHKAETGDVVFSGDGLRFDISARTEAELQIFYKHNSSSPTRIFSKYLADKEAYAFPSNDQWLALDDQEGTEEFIFLIDGHETTRYTFSHLPATSFSHYPEPVETDGIPGHKATMTSTLPKDSLIAGLKEIGKRKFIDLTNIHSKTRGAKEIGVYKRLSTATLLVQSGPDLGAGVLISEDGKILTNWHVIKNKKEIYVTFKPASFDEPDRNHYLAFLLKSDIEKDLALIQLADPQKAIGIKPVALASMSNIEVGQDAYSIGHPLGELWTFSQGMVSQVRKNYRWVTNQVSHGSNYTIQTQSPISRGSSGGPLVNENVELIGINTLSRIEGQNLNYAVSVADIEEFLMNKMPSPTEASSDKLTIPKIALEKAVKTLKGHDSMGNKITHLYIDQDSNGKVDMSAIDTLDNGTWNAFYSDKNENRIYEEVKFDKNDNGIVELTFRDSDEDGSWDLVGYDRDEDGQIERWSNY